MSFIGSAQFFTLLLAATVLIGCGTPSDPARLNEARRKMYERADSHFRTAVFYKPSDFWNHPTGVALAPLLMQEITGSAPEISHIGKLVTKGDAITIDRAQPALYFDLETVELKGRQRDRALFVWFHELNGKIVPQGIRITLDSDQHPAIWEVLNDTTGIQQIFVSQSLDAAASEALGAPLPGRQSALEPGLQEAPDVVVSRVISDGPMAMGPVVYLNAKHHDVATLICRCMVPQVEELASTVVYEVVEMNDSKTNETVHRALKQARIPVSRWFNEPPMEMERRLRLPDGF